MKDVSYAVKVSPELKNKVNEMIKVSGMMSKEWFETLVSLYEIEQLKQGSKDFSKDLSELELHTNRINQLVVNMVQRANHEKEKVLQQIEEIISSRDEIIQGYQKELSELKEQAIGYAQQVGQAEKNNIEATKHAQRLEETIENNKALIAEYKEKIETSSSLVNEYKVYSEENKALEAILKDLEEEISKQKTKVNELTNELSRYVEQYKVNLSQLEERKDLEKERSILKLRTEYQEKLQKANEDYTTRVQLLYEEINSMRKGFEKEIETLKNEP